MKRIILFIIALILLSAVMLLPSHGSAVSAQDATVTPTYTAGELDVLNQAKAALAAANAATTASNNLNNSANGAVSLVNLMLAFISVVGLLGAAVASAGGYFAARAGLRTLSEYSDELTKARADLDEMRQGLVKQTEAVVAQSERSIRALTLMQLGEQQLDVKNVKGALKMYEQAYDLDPTNRAINYFLGELYVQDRQLEKGIEHLHKALSNDNDYAPAEAALGYALRLLAQREKDPIKRDKQYAGAEERFLRALELDQNVLDVNGESVKAVLGGLYKRQGRIDRAISLYSDATKVTPQSSYPVSNLAILQFMEGKLDAALPNFELSETMSTRRLDLNPYDYWARLDRLTARLALGKTQLAQDDEQMVLQQVKTPGPLETNLEELDRLKSSPKPPQNVDKVIEDFQDAVHRMKHEPAKPVPSAT